MARVSIETRAFHDPRLTVAGRILRLSAPALGWKLAFAWSYVTEAADSSMALDQVAACIGRNPDDVRTALVRADLAVTRDPETLDLEPMRALFGDYEWLEEKRATAETGGKVRADTAERGDGGRFQRRDVPHELVTLLADGRPRTRAELISELRVRRGRLYREVTALLNEGTIAEHESGSVALARRTAEPAAEPVSVATAEPVSAATAEPVPAPPRNPAPSSALAPAPAPAPARERAGRARTPGTGPPEPHALSRNPEPREPEPGNPEPRDPAEPESWTLDRLTAATDIAPRGERRAIARALWLYQDARRRSVDPNAPDVPLVEAPGGALDAVVLALARYTPAQCVHALDVFAVEATCKRDLGDDALEYLNGRSNWRDEALGRAVATTPEAMRKRYSNRLRDGYAPPAPHDSFRNPEPF